MTAEVAILNKSAVALAADSAVIIGRPPNMKIYNTVNKIFELSEHNPIGIMIYGRLDYMGLPLETIIKQYRKNLRDKSFDTVEMYAADFCQYMSNNVPFDATHAESNVATIIYDFFSRANSDVDDLVMEDIIKRGSFKKSKTNTITQKYINDKIRVLKSTPFAVGFSRKSIPVDFVSLIDGMIDHCFRSNRPTETTKKIIRDYAGYVLSKQILSDYRTGVVIAGFGDAELCPSLYQFEMDGIVDSKLKVVHRPYVDIDRHGPEADILGFAQDDMMKSFLNGVDPVIHEYFAEISKTSIKDTAGLILKSIFNDPIREEATMASIQQELDQLGDDLFKKMNEYIEKKSANPIREMIRSMPKQELATLASSLIEITSLKRKVTRVQETVGGEVDVAIISKSEGFVWTKRKHYFPPELNKRFFVRHFE